MNLMPVANEVFKHGIRKSDSELNFDAWTQDVYDFDGDKIQGYKSIYRRMKNSDVRHLGIVSSRYHLTQNWEMFGAAERALENIFGEDFPCEIRDEFTDDGATSLRQYLLRGTERKIDGSPSRLIFRVVASNNFDGSGSRKLIAGDIDFFCTNGRISGEYDKFVSAHNGEFKMDKMSNFIKMAHIQFGKEADRADGLRYTAISHEKAVNLLHKLCDTDIFKKNIEAVYDENCSFHGSNLWALTSTATWWASTHQSGWANPSSDASLNKAPVRRLNRQHDVRRWMASNVVPLIQKDIEDIEFEEVV